MQIVRDIVLSNYLPVGCKIEFVASTPPFTRAGSSFSQGFVAGNFVNFIFIQIWFILLLQVWFLTCVGAPWSFIRSMTPQSPSPPRLSSPFRRYIVSKRRIVEFKNKNEHCSIESTFSSSSLETRPPYLSSPFPRQPTILQHAFRVCIVLKKKCFQCYSADFYFRILL